LSISETSTNVVGIRNCTGNC